jgi:lipoyl(octanoyl) transferase
VKTEAKNQARENWPHRGNAQRYSSPLTPWSSPVVRHLGCVDYLPTWQAMRDFTLKRTVDTPDELWLLQHPPVYTLGIAARAQHLPRFDNGIPIVKTDRGGQITYHGPGQLVVYLLLDMKHRGLSVRPLVRLMENAVIDLLVEYGVTASGRVDAPGVYAGNAKVAALGLRIRNGCCYHGIALNADMDLEPFRAIDPCGYPGLEVTQTRDLGITATPDILGDKLIQHLATRLQTH